MSAAWLAHAPPPPPTTTVRKPRRSSSYEPLASQNGSMLNDTHTRGGYLPPSSHSPEPSRPRRTSSDLKEATSSSTPSSPVKRVRSKVTSNPVPPAPSAFYNYQHQLQQQQQQRLYQQHQQPAYAPPQASQQPAQDVVFAHSPATPSSVAMAHSRSESTSTPAYAGYARERRDSAPSISYSAPQPQPAIVYTSQPTPTGNVLPTHSLSYAATAGPPVTFPGFSSAQAAISPAAPSVVPASHLQHLPLLHGAVPSTQHIPTSQQQQQWTPAPQSQPLLQLSGPSYYTGVTAPSLQQPWEQSSPSMPSPQQAAVVFPVSHAAAPPGIPANAHPISAMQTSSPPMPASNGMNGGAYPAYVTELSRQSTTSSVSSSRRPLPQPTRTSSNPSAPGSPVTGAVGLTNRASVRRGLPTPPSGSPATISAASNYGSPNFANGETVSPGSPTVGAASRLPPTALNRTESVRLAAEALMARGVPQRRPLRSALASTTFSPPLRATRLAGSPLTHDRDLPSSQSEPVAASTGPSAAITAQPLSKPAVSFRDATPRTSQSAGSVLNNVPDPASKNTGDLPDPCQPRAADRTTTSAPARYQDAMQQAAQPKATHVADLSEIPRHQETSSLVDSMAGMLIDQTPKQTPAVSSPAATVPVFSFNAPEEEPEKPRRRRGSSVSRSAPTPGQKVVQQAPSTPAVPILVLPSGDDDAELDSGPSISVSGPDGEDASIVSGPKISVSADDDDARSQTSNDSKGPSISVSFSAEPSARSQRAGTSHSPATGPHAKAGPENGRVSASSVGSGSGCHGCRKWIAGKVVHALGTTFHPNCFVCAHCSEGLEHVAFYEHEGLPYCHFDYHELFSKRCFHCRTPIVDERYITVQDEELTGQDGETKERCYHELHFFCANCGDPFLDPKAAGSAAGSDPGLMTADENGKVKHGGMEFIVHKGYPYCERCHISLHKPRCKGCKKPIVYDLITALGSKYHPECFTCNLCLQPFTDTQFFVKDGKAYDEECYKVLLRNMI